MLNFKYFPVVYLTVSIIISVIIGVYAWRNPQTRGSRAFAISCLISILWMCGDLITELSGNFAEQRFGLIIKYFATPILPVAFFVFIRQYCGKPINIIQINFLLIVPFITWLVVLTNHRHHLFFTKLETGIQGAMTVELGAYYWSVHLLYSHGLIIASFITVLMELSRASRHYRKQISLLFFALCIPVFVNILFIYKIIGNFTPLSFPIIFPIMAYAMFRHQFLGSNPIAYETVFNTIRDGVLILDRHDIIRDINSATAKCVEKAPTEIIGLHFREIAKIWQPALEAYDKNPLKMGEIEIPLFGQNRVLSVESTPLVEQSGLIEGRIITVRDVTENHQHKISLEKLAFHDPLTRLANRRKFQEEVELAIEKSNRSGKSLAIIYFDLNRFKLVNDKYGHEIGDELLKYVSARVVSILRKPDILARLGGDEFALLLHDCDENGIENVIERMLEKVARPFQIGEKTLIADLSIGAAIYPQHGKNLTELLRHADSEMYRAKQSGNGWAMQQQKIDLTVGMEM